LESNNVVYGVIHFYELDNILSSKKILNRDSISQIITDINNSEFIGIDSLKKAKGNVILVVKDSGAVRIDILKNAIRIPVINKCYKLNEKYKGLIQNSYTTK
jgi:hypothetical protein